MVNKSPAEELRRQIASVISDEKAHEVPRICSRYGLADGTGEEAFNGKFRYVINRLHMLETTDVLQVGRAIQIDYQNRALGHALAVVEDADQPQISMVTRRRLLKLLGGWQIEGDLDLIEFLEPVFDLDAIPSLHADATFDNFDRKVRADIEQHCVRNDDWDVAELLRSLGFMTCHQTQIFSLLERVVDPEVINEPTQAERADAISSVLGKDGYALQISGTISGSDLYKVGGAGAPGATPADKEITALMTRFDEAGIHDLWAKALERRHRDPDGAITIARTYLEQTCKHILDEERVPYPDDVGLPKLWSLCAEQMNLAPSQHTEEAFKAILGSCQNVVNTLGTIRNRIGDSHGQRGKPVRAKPRHAQLAVNLAGSMSTFLLATWEDQSTTGAKANQRPGEAKATHG